jgi:hypothetical protein
LYNRPRSTPSVLSCSRHSLLLTWDFPIRNYCSTFISIQQRARSPFKLVYYVCQYPFHLATSSPAQSCNSACEGGLLQKLGFLCFFRAPCPCPVFIFRLSTALRLARRCANRAAEPPCASIPKSLTFYMLTGYDPLTDEIR